MAGGQTKRPVNVRSLTSHDEFAQAVEVQRTVWRFDELDLLPVRLFVVAEKVGGQVLGAFDGDRMVGFCLSIPGIRERSTYLHSHMLGVLPEFRDAGVGRALKLAQRDDALARGFELIEWTFDPLELKNAHFNIERLGAVVSRYVLNQYGISTSPLHGGLPTDRCTAQWWIRSPRVEEILAGGVAGQGVEGRLEIPSDILEIKRRDPRLAGEIQARVSGEFQALLAKGWTATGFERTPETGAYLFGPWHSA